MTMSILEITQLAKSFRSGAETLCILEDVSLSLEVATVAVVTGESGSGKSTLLNLIAGLDFPSSGEIQCAGRRVSHLSEKELTDYRSRVIGLVFQFHYLLKEFTAEENVMLPSYMAGVAKRDARGKAIRLLTDVGLADRAGHFPHELSGGERQRVAVARALVNDPEIILADEPTGNLDERNSRVVEDVLFSLARKYGKTLILVTHDPELTNKGDRRFHIARRTVEEL